MRLFRILSRQSPRQALPRLKLSDDHMFLHSSRLVEESHDGRFARATIRTLVGGLILGAFWASVTPVYEVTSGTGTLQPQSETERVEHLEGGIVAALHTSKGATVAAGDLILTLDPRPIEAEIAKLRADRVALQSELARLTWALDGPPESVLAAGSRVQPDGDPAFMADIAFRRAQLDVMRAERRVREVTLESLSGRQAKLSQEERILRGQVSRYAQKGAAAAIPLREREAIERNLLQVEQSVLSIAGDRARLIAEIESSKLREREYLAANRREAALSLADLQAQLTRIDESIAQLEDRVERTEVRSVTSGVIQDLTIANSGEVISPGELIAEIVPVGTPIVAQVEIPADRIGGVAEGMDASIKVLTHDFTRFGDVEARVSAISPSSYVNDAGGSVFRVEIVLPGDGVDLTLGGRPVSPGMTVLADIRSGSKSIMTYLLKPLRVLSDRAFSES